MTPQELRDTFSVVQKNLCLLDQMQNHGWKVQLWVRDVDHTRMTLASTNKINIHLSKKDDLAKWVSQTGWPPPLIFTWLSRVPGMYNPVYDVTSVSFSEVEEKFVLKGLYWDCASDMPRKFLKELLSIDDPIMLDTMRSLHLLIILSDTSPNTSENLHQEDAIS